MTVHQIQREEPVIIRHEEEWLDSELGRAERRALFVGGAWGVLMGALLGMAVGMPLTWYIFYRAVI